MGSNRHVLFLSRPDENHLYLTLAVAEELGRRGHAVTFATSDPFAEEDAEAGVVLVRHGRDARTLRTLPAFVERLRGHPVDLVVCEPASYDDALELGGEWGVAVVVAHTNLAAGDGSDWPAEQDFGADYLYVHPAGRGSVFGEWAPADTRPVLAVAHQDVPLELLAEAFDERDWQVLVLGDDLARSGVAPNITVVPAGFAVLDHADVVLTDGALPGIAAGLGRATPLVLVPGTPVQYRHARLVAGLGVGEVVRRADLTADALRRAVARLAVDEAALAAARRVRSRVRAAGAAEHACDLLEARLDVAHRRAA